MPSRFDDLNVANGDVVQAKDMPDALTAATSSGGSPTPESDTWSAIDDYMT